MGGKQGVEAGGKARSKQVEADLANDQQQDRLINKLLLLGAGESGKSTLFKQMITIYGKGFNAQDRAKFLGVIHQNIMNSIRVLCEMSPTFGPVTPENQASLQVINNEVKSDDQKLDSNIGKHILALWKDAGIQKTYGQRAKFQLNDSAAYFFDRLGQILDEGDKFMPTDQDVLRKRVRTNGIVENDFEIENNKFKMIDVGGQRNERKKWIHCFEGVTAVLFVAAISEYDQVCYEDDTTNRMVEALNLFDEIANSRWFDRASMILFLNKRDLFADKIAKVPLTVCFPEYTGPQTFEAGATYIKDLFEAKNKNPRRTIYSHVTCATDTTNVAAVFNAVKDTVIRLSLSHAGLI